MAVGSGRVCEVKLEAQDIKHVKSGDLFRLMAEVYSISEEDAQDATMGGAAMYSYKMADARPGEKNPWHKDIPEDWSKAKYGSINLSVVLRDLLKRGLVDEGEYIITHSW